MHKLIFIAELLGEIMPNGTVSSQSGDTDLGSKLSENSQDDQEAICLEPQISQIIADKLKLTEMGQRNDYVTLAKVSTAALSFFPPLYFQSVFGRLSSWLPPHRQYSEYSIIDAWRPLRTAKYLFDISVPAFSHAPGPLTRTFLPPVIQHMFWRPSNYFQQADPFDSVTSFEDEQWIFINGICTNNDVAKLNSSLISQIFKRPISVVHNATDSTVVDLMECVIGKTFETDPSLDDSQSMTEPAIKATVAVLAALKDPQKQKVVLLCHSQGTIITANVLRALKNTLTQIKAMKHGNEICHLDSLSQIVFELCWQESFIESSVEEVDNQLIAMMKKLEVYTFANCADKMTYVCYGQNERCEDIGLPYIENFANQFDLVARLGIISPLRDPDAENPIIDIDGGVYEKQGPAAWGHLLNQHYLFGMEDFLANSQSSQNPYQASPLSVTQGMPRLYSYYNGKRVSSYYT